MIRALTTPDHPPRSTRAGRRFAFAAAAVVCASILALTACRLDPAQRTESPVQPGAASAARRLIAPVDEPSKPTELTEDAIDDPAASVVAVYAVRDGGGDSSDRPEGDAWLGDERRPRSASRCDQEPAQVAGSGVLIDARGLVLTAAHVVRAARSVRVSLADGREVGAVRWAADPMTDLAVVQLDVAVGSPAGFGDADLLVPGRPVRLMANPWDAAPPGAAVVIPGQVGPACDWRGPRPAPRAGVSPDSFAPPRITLLADARPGCSGGPVFDSGGRLVGIVSARRETGERPVCVAIPINERTRTVIDQLKIQATD